ncbi:MAG: hypothetical protein LBS40_03990 [Burkholderiales bacterium]|jgi:hypothetical protein|nr:hypothetical protein [Burkholderiales bacterium]
MKRSRKAKKRAAKSLSVNKTNDFVRGFVACALIAALERNAQGRRAGFDRRVLCRATQGGIALVAGVAAGHATQRREYTTALTATVVGLAGVYATDRLMKTTSLPKE